jgi:hypothetical protein
VRDSASGRPSRLIYRKNKREYPHGQGIHGPIVRSRGRRKGPLRRDLAPRGAHGFTPCRNPRRAFPYSITRMLRERESGAAHRISHEGSDCNGRGENPRQVRQCLLDRSNQVKRDQRCSWTGSRLEAEEGNRAMPFHRLFNYTLSQRYLVRPCQRARSMTPSTHTRPAVRRLTSCIAERRTPRIRDVADRGCHVDRVRRLRPAAPRHPMSALGKQTLEEGTCERK